MEDNEIREIAKKHGIEFCHFDKFDEPRYKNAEDWPHNELKDAIVVFYPSRFGCRNFAINADGSVIRPFEKEKKEVEALKKEIEEFLTNAKGEIK